MSSMQRLTALAMLDQRGMLSQEQKLAYNELKNRYSNFNEAASSVIEPALTIGSSMVAEPVSGFVGLAGLPFGNDVAANAVTRTQNAMTYQPKTEAGQESINRLGGFMQGIADKVNPLAAGTVASLYGAIPFTKDKPSDIYDRLPKQGLSGDIGALVAEKTGSPEWATVASLYPTAMMELMGLKGASKIPGKQMEFGDVGGQAFKQRGAIGGVSDDVIDFYHGGSFEGGDIDSTFGQRGNLGSFYATSSEEAARNHAKSGYFDVDDIGDNPGVLSRISVNRSELLDLDSVTFDDLVGSVGVEPIIDNLSSNFPEKYEELAMHADSLGFDDVDEWLSGDGISELEEYVNNRQPDISFEAPSVAGTEVGVFLTTEPDLARALLDNKGKKGFFYDDSDYGGVSVALQPEANIRSSIIEDYR